MIAILTFIIIFSSIMAFQGYMETYRSYFAKKCQRAYDELINLRFVEAPSFNPEYNSTELRGFNKNNTSIYPDFVIDLRNYNCKIYSFRDYEWIWGDDEGFLAYTPAQWYWRNRFKKWFIANLYYVSSP